MAAPEDHCEGCGGSGQMPETVKLEARVPAGSYGGLQIRHAGKGELGDPGAPRGDLYLTLDVQPHEVFKRDGADVYVTGPVPYPVMALGGDINIPTVYGEEEFAVPRGTPSGEVFVLRGKGVDVTDVVDHGWCKSIYFRDPNYLQLEYCVVTEELGERHVTDRSEPGWTELARA